MSNTRVVNGPGFRICYDDEPDYLRAYVFDGTDSQDVSIAMWRMLAGECHALGASRLLVLEDLLSTVEVAEIEGVIDAMEAAVGVAPGIPRRFVRPTVTVHRALPRGASALRGRGRSGAVRPIPSSRTASRPRRD